MNLLRCALVVVGGLLMMSSALAQTQNYPTRPVTLVVPFPPGGGTDTGARLLAQKLSQRWGQSVIIDNRPGAAGIIGADLVSRATPDGYTLLIGNIGTQSINPSLYKKIPYNADTAFAPISMIAELPLVLVVHPAVPARTAKELIALAKAKPGTLAYSTSGPGGAMHLAGALFESAADIQLLHVPYKGGGPAIQDLLGGQVTLSFATILETSGHIRTGKLRALAVTGEKRNSAFPDVPTLSEGTLPGYNSVSWIGLLAPAGTPPALIDKISNDVNQVLTTPELNEKFTALGAIPGGSSPAQFQSAIDNDKRKYAQIIRQKGITAE